MRRATVSFETSPEVDCLVAAAVDAYLEARIPRSALRSVLKLHSIAEPGEFLKLTREEKYVLRNANLTRAMWKPIYAWQGMDWLVGESCANALAHAHTKPFVDFVVRAWDENWPTPRLTETEHKSPSGNLRFRDFALAKELVKWLRSKVSKLKTPCVFRQFS